MFGSYLVRSIKLRTMTNYFDDTCRNDTICVQLTSMSVTVVLRMQWPYQFFMRYDEMLNLSVRFVTRINLLS